VLAPPSAIEAAFRSRERTLWSLCYRMTGVAADADELLQETFVRALEAPHGLDGRDLERWLVRVATNLSLDALRRRKRRRYVGSWLPGPVETPEPASAPEDDAEHLYWRSREVSYAFLVALEALGPKARAVLLLADLLDYSSAEIATLLGLSEANVRVLHHRARRTLEEARIARHPATSDRDRQKAALERFVTCMMTQDAAGMAAILADDVRSVTDAAGRYTALREPLEGRDRVVRFHLETAKRRAPVSRSELRWINGSLALVVETAPLRPQMAPRLVLRCEVDDDGRIREIQTVLAPDKLTAVRFSAPVAEEAALPLAADQLFETVD
jgi:RNA polymerase sigma-70 factor (ECF subfamily)